MLNYILLVKPRIQLLLIFTTICPMILASKGQFQLDLILWVSLGGLLVSSSAAALNCILERDIDALMERTKVRPMPRGAISVAKATTFALFIGISGVALLAIRVSFQAALISFAGFFIYIFIYTLLLKRRSSQNIVIGGAAGAIPPVVGWVAVTGQLDLVAVLLFLFVFLWTPPHFWALAMNKADDYRRASIPMMPLVVGNVKTERQMLIYAVLLLPVVAGLIAVEPQLGLLSGLLMGLSGLIFVHQIYQLRKISPEQEEQKLRSRWNVFSFSLAYMSLFFCSLIVDSMI